MGYNYCEECKFYNEDLEGPHCNNCYGTDDKENWVKEEEVKKDCSSCETLNCNTCSN